MAQLRRGHHVRRGRIHPALIGGLIAAALLAGFPPILALLVGALGLLVAVLVTGLLFAVLAAPFLIFGVGLATIWRGRRRRGRPFGEWRQARVERPAAPHGPGSADAFHARLPEEARTRIEGIRRKALGLLQRAERFPTSSESLYLVRCTLHEYLPATVNSYLALPSGAENQPVAPDGRTGLQVLRDQLAILDRKLDEIAVDLSRDDVERLLANGRFLEQRFGPPRIEDGLGGGKPGQ